MDIRAIETQYNGYAFRSRLEARWAVFFNTLGVRYEYEKEGYDLGAAGYYLLDFWLPEVWTRTPDLGDEVQGVWAEVRGYKKDGAEQQYFALSEHTGHAVLELTRDPYDSVSDRGAPRMLYEDNTAPGNVYYGARVNNGYNGYNVTRVGVDCYLCAACNRLLLGYVGFGCEGCPYQQKHPPILKAAVAARMERFGT